MKHQPITQPAAQPEPAWLTERNFIPASSDPAQLTLTDARAVFGGDLSALKDVIKLAKEVQRRPTVPVIE